MTTVDSLEKLRTSLAGRYEVERELGRGGMATVYLARDLRHERKVAIKVLLPDLAASVGNDRFIREIHLAASLQHIHILSLYDSGEADGLLYYVMPFVEGESLRNRLDRERMLPVDEAIRLTIEVAEALGYAHAHGIVHRDIKPENILLANGHALVADFGIARAFHVAEEHKLTQTGVSIGTPHYMSPEQATGDEVGPSSDLYSLGCVAFELVTGQPPFTGVNAHAIMARQTLEPPPSIRLVRDTVPEEIEATIHWALAKNPADRPRDAAQFISGLVMPAGQTSGSRPVTAGLKPGQGVRKHRRRVRLTAALVAALVLGGAATWAALAGGAATGEESGLDPRTIAVLNFDDNSADKRLGYLVDGLAQDLRGELRKIPELRVISRGGADQVTRTMALDSVGRLLNAGTLVRGSVEPTGSDIQVSIALIEGGSGEIFQRATFRRSASDELALADALVQEMAELVRARLGSEIRLRRQRVRTADTEAWVLFQQGEGKQREYKALYDGGETAQAASAFAQADSLYAAAQRRDRKWIEPRTERGRLAFTRSRNAIDDVLVAERWVIEGLGHADSALLLDSRDPDALEVRGNLRYWKWLLQIERDSARARALLGSAQADLELARTVRPSQAGAWATLSHLYNQSGTITEVKNAAQRALEADAFLSNAGTILRRIFYAAYDDGDVIGARNACRQLNQRFPEKPDAASCQLTMMTMRGSTPDHVLAWHLVDSLVARSPDPQKEYERLAGAVWTAAILARAGLFDSARAVVQRSSGDPTLDPSRELALLSAFVYVTLGDTLLAIEQMRSYLDVNPGQRQSYRSGQGWWFRPIENHPRWRDMVGL
jgi:TolB-like protein